MHKQAIAVTGGTLFDGTERDPIDSACLIVQGDRVVYAGPEASASIPPGAEIVDATGHAIIPGIIDGHMHLTTMPAFLDTSGHLEQNIRAISKLRSSLARGVTSVVNVGGCAESLPLKVAIEGGSLPPMARMLVAGMLNSTGGHVRGYAADGPWEVRRGVRHLIAAGADAIKTAVTGGFMWKHEKLEWLDYTEEELAAMVSEAHAKGKSVQVHAHAQPGLNVAIRAGCDVILHGALADDEAIAGITRSGLFFMPTLCITSEQSYSRPSLPAHMVERMKHAHPIHRQAVRHALEQGAKVCVGTDGGPGDAVLELVELCRCGARPLEALRMGTAETARALLLNERLGTLEEGKLADFVVADIRVLSDVESLTHDGAVKLAFVGGRRMVCHPDWNVYCRRDSEA
jgi:imidazolonepropionase-like amidohydrolase